MTNTNCCEYSTKTPDDGQRNDGNASMPEQVKRSNPWKMMMMMMMMMMMDSKSARNM